MKVKIKKLNDKAITPTYGSKGAACFDLYSTETAEVSGHRAATFDTGVAFEVPDNHVILVFSRSGHGFKNGIRLSNCVGIIDADYRDSVKVRLHNDSLTAFDVEEGDRIAQALILPVEQVQFEEGELSKTERGTNGLGSTGR